MKQTAQLSWRWTAANADGHAAGGSERRQAKPEGLSPEHADASGRARRRRARQRTLSCDDTP